MKRTEKLIAMIFIMLLTCLPNTAGVMAEEISVVLDGERLGFDTAPVMEGDRVLVPMRAIFENLGADVVWDNDTRTAGAVQYYRDNDASVRESVAISIGGADMVRAVDTIGGDGIEYGARETVHLDAPAKIYGERTLVPLRAVAEAFGAEVQWNGNTQTVTVTSDGREVYPPRRVTVRRFLENALKPMGTTLYVYGGGWNKEDTGAGEEATTLGLSPAWGEFYRSQDASYDSSQYRYQIEKGLDCSGYVGWTIYNTLETENGKPGYVFLSREFGDRLAEMGYGNNVPREAVDGYIPGDIMSSSIDYHVWISLGQCPDGSVVLLHSSPPGVRICGTAAPDGTQSSQAVSIAERFMSERYPDWYSRYPDCYKGMSYLTNYSRFRWGDIMYDPDGYGSLTPEQVLTDLFMMRS